MCLCNTCIFKIINSSFDISDNYACKNGWMQNSYDYIIKSGGIDDESCYPYKGKVGGRTVCKLHARAHGRHL